LARRRRADHYCACGAPAAPRAARSTRTLGVMRRRAIIDTAVLIGFSPEAKCVYSATIPLSKYWDGDHAWDDAKTVQQLRLEKLRGYLFDSAGSLLQEFESTFDLGTGIFKGGWARHADGTFQKHDA
jgi:hypothetical protein